MVESTTSPNWMTWQENKIHLYHPISMSISKLLAFLLLPLSHSFFFLPFVQSEGWGPCQLTQWFEFSFFKTISSDEIWNIDETKVYKRAKIAIFILINGFSTDYSILHHVRFHFFIRLFSMARFYFPSHSVIRFFPWFFSCIQPFKVQLIRCVCVSPFCENNI